MPASAAGSCAPPTQTRTALAPSAPSARPASSPQAAVAGPAPITTSAARTPARPAAPASTAERTSAKSTGVSPSASTAATAARRSASPTATTATVAASTPARLSSARVTSRPDRSALCQPWPCDSSAGASRGPSSTVIRQARGSHSRSPSRTVTPRDHGWSTARTNSPSSRLKARAWLNERRISTWNATPGR